MQKPGYIPFMHGFRGEHNLLGASLEVDEGVSWKPHPMRQYCWWWTLVAKYVCCRRGLSVLNISSGCKFHGCSRPKMLLRFPYFFSVRLPSECTRVCDKSRFLITLTPLSLSSSPRCPGTEWWRQNTTDRNEKYCSFGGVYDIEPPSKQDLTPFNFKQQEKNTPNSRCIESFLTFKIFTLNISTTSRNLKASSKNKTLLTDF